MNIYDVIVPQVILAAFNLANSRIDAYRIMKNKAIAHAINFGAYAIVSLLLILFWQYDIKQIIFFCITAFCNRQFSFDIPLNLRRGLAWNYVTKDDPPKAVLDRIEIKILGRNGTKQFIFYAAIASITLTLSIFPSWIAVLHF